MNGNSANRHTEVHHGNGFVGHLHGSNGNGDSITLGHTAEGKAPLELATSAKAVASTIASKWYAIHFLKVSIAL